MKRLIKAPCKCGCDGCYYDMFEHCPIAEAPQDNPIGNSAEWECVIEDCIYVEVDSDE